MPDSVKISELTPRSAVGTDVLPAVDATFNSTIRVSASSIAAIGGGPPGDATVTTAKLANNSVTYAKIQQVSSLKLLGNSTGAAANVAEIPATSLGLSILNAASAAAVRTLISDTVAFTGQITFEKGTQAAPSIACKDTTTDPDTIDTDTGIYWPDQNTVGIATEGKLKWFIDGEGTQYSNIPEQFSGSDPLMRPQYSCRAWVAFNGSSATTTTINSQSTIAQRYGKNASLYYDGWVSYNSAANGLTVDKIQDMETASGNEMVEVATAAADGRENYTTPVDNYHWRWTGSAWTKLGPPLTSGQKWIGKIRFKPLSNAAFGILASGGVSSVTSLATGAYQVNFAQTMPDTNYAVNVNAQRATWSGGGGDHVYERNVAYCRVAHYEGGNLTNTSYYSVSVFR